MVKKYLGYLLLGVCMLAGANVETVSAKEAEVLEENVDVLQEELTYKPYDTATYELIYEVGEDGITITGYTGTAEGELVLPDSIGGVEVTCIGNEAFWCCSGFDGQLILPEGLKKIGDAAFQNCSGLIGDLVLPEGLNELGWTSFYGCSGFDGKLVLPTSLATLPLGAFGECSGFTGDLVLPEGLITIGSVAFAGCSGFDGELILPNSLTTIESSAFKVCSGLSGKLVLPERLSVIGWYAFDGCSGFSGDLMLPQSLTEIGNSAFLGCTGMNGNVYITHNVSTIDPTAFLFSITDGAEDNLTVRSGITINVIKGSYAETYAIQNGYNLGYWSGDLSFPFGDLPEDETNWKYTSAKYVYENDIMSGTSLASFAPDMNMNRAMFVQLLYNKEQKPEVAYENQFTDVAEGAWYSSAVTWAVNQGITSGVGGGLFGSETDITREQIATLLYGYAENKGQDVSERASIEAFPDNGNVSDWAEEAMEWAVAEGVMSGRNMGDSVQLAPKETATRAECATMIYNYCTAYGE